MATTLTPASPSPRPSSAEGGASGPKLKPSTSTSSPATRVLGLAVLAGFGALALFGLLLSPPDVEQSDAVRLLYLHVPTATIALASFAVTALGSVLWLVRRSVWWDLVAAASAEVGVLFTGLCLITGSLWGRITWGTYWDWDPRLTSTALLFLLFLGYLAVRRLPSDPAQRNKRSAIVAIVGFVDVPIVHWSVNWWRSLHQGSTISTVDVKIEGLMLFSLMLGMAVFLGLYVWLVVHRFRLGWLEDRIEERGLDVAIEERRREAAEAR